MMAAAVGWETYQKAAEIARLAVDESGMGVYEHKLAQAPEENTGYIAGFVRRENGWCDRGRPCERA